MNPSIHWRNAPKPRTIGGFTLIEVMVVVAIVALLAAIALPVYTDYVRRGRIPDATSSLSSQQVKMEQWFQDNQTYYTTSTNTACGVAAPATTTYFTFTCVASSASRYVVTATGVAGGTMAGFVYTIDESGNRTSAITGVGGWTATSSACWITNKGGIC